jgi:hypothetical protein
MYSGEMPSTTSSHPARPNVIEGAYPFRPRYPPREVVEWIERQDRQIDGSGLWHEIESIPRHSEK